MAGILWSPSLARVQNSQLSGFAAFVGERYGGRFAGGAEGFAELHRWSVENPRLFWRGVWDFCGVVGEPGGEVLIREKEIPGAVFFPEGKLNYAENLLAFGGGETAIIALRETGERQTISFGELKKQTMQLAGWMRRNGVCEGDRVAAYMPNCAETVIAMLAAASVGAVFSSCSIDFGAEGVVDRFGQITPKVLFAASGYTYKGKFINRADAARKITRALPSLAKTVMLPYPPGNDFCAREKNITEWQTAIGEGESENESKSENGFAQTAFNAPAFILYSSGTTGKPKCIVHGGGGTLLQHLKEHRLHSDIRPGGVFFYFTTCGWMMWNWLVSGLASGAAIVLYEGDPFYPSPLALWDAAAREKIHYFGASAKYFDALRKSGLRPAEGRDLSELQTVFSTGSPLSADCFDFVYRDIKNDVQLASISGGTDIVSCFVLGNPWQSVRRGEIQGAGLGMAMEVLDEDGGTVTDMPGELVCARPFPSMPLGFWRDDSGEKYRGAYFTKYKNKWRHGDWAEKKDSGGFVIHGRSDETLNPGGVRIGTAEIYRPAEALEEIAEALAVGQRRGGEERIVLFVKMAGGKTLDEPLREKIRNAVRESATPRHIPAKIIAVADIPRTRSGKISESVVRDIIHGVAPKNRAALANPESLSLYENLQELGDD